MLKPSNSTLKLEIGVVYNQFSSLIKEKKSVSFSLKLTQIFAFGISKSNLAIHNATKLVFTDFAKDRRREKEFHVFKTYIYIYKYIFVFFFRVAYAHVPNPDKLLLFLQATRAQNTFFNSKANFVHSFDTNKSYMYNLKDN